MTPPREPRDRVDAIQRRDPDALEAVAQENLEPLLRGARGRRPADLDALAQVIKNVGDAALSIRDGSLRALEINPLWVNGDRIEALDVLVVTCGRQP